MKVIVFILIAPLVFLLSALDLIVMIISLFFVVFRDSETNKYIKRNFLGIDQRINALLFGDEDETISSRMGKHVAKHDNLFCNIICKLLNLIQKDHCQKAIEKDRGLPM